MAIFTVHVPAALGNRMTAAERAVVVPEAFCWSAFIFGPLWYLLNRAWIGLAVALALSAGGVALAAILHPSRDIILALTLLVSLFHGFEARQLLRFGLALAGYRLADVIVAQRTRDAEHAFFLRWLADTPPKPPRAGSANGGNDIIGLFPEAEAAT